MVEQFQRTDLAQRLVAHEEIARDRHQRDHRQMLVHGCNSRCNGVARIGKLHRVAFKQNLALGGFMHPGHGLDKGRFSRPIVAQQAMAFARKQINRHTSKGNHRTEVLFDILHLQDGGLGAGHVISPQ